MSVIILSYLLAFVQLTWQVGTSLLCFYVYLLYYTAVLLKFTYNAQELELWQKHYAIYIQVCMNNSLLQVANNLRKTVLLECIYKWYQNNYSIMLDHSMTVLLEYINCILQFSINAWLLLLVYFTCFLLCLMLSITHYAQNYTGPIGGSLLASR